MKVLIATGEGRLDAAPARAVRRHGREAVVAADAAAVLALAASLRPPLCLLGEGLPGESGWLVCAKLRIAGFAETLVLTGRSPRHRVRDLAEAAGAARYVAAEDCVSQIAELLRGHARAAAPGRTPR